jgi:hypothetical protein
MIFSHNHFQIRVVTMAKMATVLPIRRRRFRRLSEAIPQTWAKLANFRHKG